MIAANKDLAARIVKLGASNRQTGSVIDMMLNEIDGITGRN